MGGANASDREIGVLVNGERRAIREGETVAALLARLEIADSRVAVEHNRAILRRERFSEVVLEDGDRLEIVHFVGGG